MADLKLTKNQTLVLSVLEESSIPSECLYDSRTTQ
jgi:hypothetical protein